MIYKRICTYFIKIEAKFLKLRTTQVTVFFELKWRTDVVLKYRTEIKFPVD